MRIPKHEQSYDIAGAPRLNNLVNNIEYLTLSNALEYCQGRDTLCVREVYSQVPHWQNGRKGQTDVNKPKDNHSNKEEMRHVLEMRKTMFSIGEHLIELRLKSGKRYVTLRSVLQLRLRLTQRDSSNMPGQN